MEKIDFVCPMCRGEEYEIHYVGEKYDLILPSEAEISHYECNNCSIHFGDPNKFNFIDVTTVTANEIIEKMLNK